MSGTKVKSHQTTVNPFELGKEAVRSVKQGTMQEAQESGKTFLSQLLGIDFDDPSKTADSKETVAEQASDPQQLNGIEIFVAAKHQFPTEKAKVYAEKAPKTRIEAAIDYHGDIVKNREKFSKKEMHEIHESIEQIKNELSKLVASSQVLKMEFAEVTVEQTSHNIGQYHLNFFEWILNVIRSARQKVEDSNSWMSAVKGKGAKRGYWGMFKKHGTTFGLSGERAVATQVG